MKQDEIVFMLDVIKTYTTQTKEFRNKFVDVLKSIDEEIDKGVKNEF